MTESLLIHVTSAAFGLKGKSGEVIVTAHLATRGPVSGKSITLEECAEPVQAGNDLKLMEVGLPWV